jgi:uncharacterized damage-inducible protein DinB
MKILLSQLSTYHLWANGQLLDAIRLLPQTQIEQTLVSSFSSMQATVLHMWDAESIWWQRLRLQEQIVRPSDDFNGTFDELATQLLSQSKQWNAWVLAAQEHMFDHEFIYQNTKKEKFKQPVYQVLLQVFNHATYHRGQLITMLRQVGATQIPNTDFIAWSRKKSTGSK